MESCADAIRADPSESKARMPTMTGRMESHIRKFVNKKRNVRREAGQVKLGLELKYSI